MILVYRFLQALAIVACELYFGKIIYINRERLREKSPLLIVSNHPNTMIDPLVALMYVREDCHLLANYSMFKNPIAGAILRTLFCIPVQRVQDVPEGQPLKNQNAFQKSEEHLVKGGSLFVAPEGTSFTERHIRECKTGAARIVLEAEKATDFKLNLRVLPIGLTYDNPLKFGSNIVVHVGDVFSADDWQKNYTENPRQAIQDFTQTIENQLIEHTVHCRNVVEDRFLQKIETILQSERPIDLEGRYFRSRIFLRKMHEWQDVFLDDYMEFSHHVEQYFAKLDALKLRDVKLGHGIDPLSILKLLLGLPFFLLGLIFNGLPAFLCNKMVSWLKIDAAYDTTIRVCAGLIFFPIFWWLQTELFCYWLFPAGFDLNWWQTIALSASYAVLGLTAWGVYTEGTNLVNFFRYKNLDKHQNLSHLRQPIIEQLATLS